MNEELREAMRAIRELTDRIRRLESTVAEYRSETQRLQSVTQRLLLQLGEHLNLHAAASELALKSLTP